MPSRPSKILLLAADAAAARRLQDALASSFGGDSAVVVSAAPAAAIPEAESERPDVLIVDLDALGDSWTDTLTELRHEAPGVPIIAFARNCDETRAIAALQAGAHDCLRAVDLEDEPLLRAVRYAIERGRFETRRDERDTRSPRERELGDLSAIGGPVPVPVTERSLGAESLHKAMPEAFDESVQRYGVLLDRILLDRSPKEYNRMTSELNVIADRLGMLGAGPRDVVELHKVAMATRLDGHSVHRDRAYIEEGRLLLVQLMGFLASHYRSMSWGRRAVRKTRGGPHAPANAGASPTWKKPQ